MITLHQKIALADIGNETIDGEVVLPIDLRIKSRARATLTDGREVGWIIERGDILRGGDLLLSNSEPPVIVRVQAAKETVSRVRTDNAHLLLQAAYHLGNRHVAVEIHHHYLAYRHDHVLDDMLQGLGLNVEVGEYPFEPESGAYQQSAHHGHHHD